jgi:hypothetical protein
MATHDDDIQAALANFREAEVLGARAKLAAKYGDAAEIDALRAELDALQAKVARGTERPPINVNAASIFAVDSRGNISIADPGTEGAR